MRFNNVRASPSFRDDIANWRGHLGRGPLQAGRTNMNRLQGISLALIAMIGMLATAAAQQTADQATDEELKQNFAAEHELGRRFQVDPNKLPEPKASPIATNRSIIVPYAGQAPSVPEGFTATPFATGL